MKKHIRNNNHRFASLLTDTADLGTFALHSQKSKVHRWVDIMQMSGILVPICVSGGHGSGKTSFCKEMFHSTHRKYIVLNELTMSDPLLIYDILNNLPEGTEGLLLDNIDLVSGSATAVIKNLLFGMVTNPDNGTQKKLDNVLVMCTMTAPSNDYPQLPYSIELQYNAQDYVELYLGMSEYRFSIPLKNNRVNMDRRAIALLGTWAGSDIRKFQQCVFEIQYHSLNSEKILHITTDNLWQYVL